MESRIKSSITLLPTDPKQLKDLGLERPAAGAEKFNRQSGSGILCKKATTTSKPRIPGLRRQRLVGKPNEEPLQLQAVQREKSNHCFSESVQISEQIV